MYRIQRKPSSELNENAVDDRPTRNRRLFNLSTDLAVQAAIVSYLTESFCWVVIITHDVSHMILKWWKTLFCRTNHNRLSTASKLVAVQKRITELIEVRAHCYSYVLFRNPWKTEQCALSCMRSNPRYEQYLHLQREDLDIYTVRTDRHL